MPVKMFVFSVYDDNENKAQVLFEINLSKGVHLIFKLFQVNLNKYKII